MIGTKGKGKGKPVPDSALRDTENVPLSEIDAELKDCTNRILTMIGGLAK